MKSKNQAGNMKELLVAFFQETIVGLQNMSESCKAVYNATDSMFIPRNIDKLNTATYKVLMAADCYSEVALGFMKSSYEALSIWRDGVKKGQLPVAKNTIDKAIESCEKLSELSISPKTKRGKEFIIETNPDWYKGGVVDDDQRKSIEHFFGAVAEKIAEKKKYFSEESQEIIVLAQEQNRLKILKEHLLHEAKKEKDEVTLASYKEQYNAIKAEEESLSATLKEVSMRETSLMALKKRVDTLNIVINRLRFRWQTALRFNISLREVAKALSPLMACDIERISLGGGIGQEVILEALFRATDIAEIDFKQIFKENEKAEAEIKNYDEKLTTGRHLVKQIETQDDDEFDRLVKEKPLTADGVDIKETASETIDPFKIFEDN